jgi:hypothetical protein
MGILLALLALVPAADDGQAVPAAEVRGNLATRVMFKGADSDRAAEACLELLASCHYSRVPAEGPLPGWADTYSQAFNTRSHLHVRLAKPRAVKCADGVAVEVSEMLVLLPLNNGGLWVRVGDEAKAFGKYEHDKCVVLQRVLNHAEPEE